MGAITIFQVLQACDAIAKQHRDFRHAEHFPGRRVPYPTRDVREALIENTGASKSEAEEALRRASQQSLVMLGTGPSWLLTEKGVGYLFVLAAPLEELDGLLEMRVLAERRDA